MVLMAIQRLQDPYYQGFAAQAAFYYMMSIVPLIIVLSQMLNIFNISTDFIQEIVSRYLPGVIGDSLSGWLTQSDNTTTSIVLTIVALWAASRAQFSMTRITNYTMSGGKSTGKGYFQERFRALFTIFVTIIALSFGLVAVVFGEYHLLRKRDSEVCWICFPAAYSQLWECFLSHLYMQDILIMQ